MSGYIGVQPVPQATQTRDIITATAGQTSFATKGYTPQFLDVYLNGVHLQDGTDYTASNGSDVVLTTGAAVDDVLEVVAYTTFELVSPTFSGTLTADNISDGTDTVETGYVVNGSAKAWVNLNGTGTIAARDSFNVASLTDNGTGIYTISFSTSFDGPNYSLVASSEQQSGTTIDVTVSFSDLLAGGVKVVAVAAGSAFDSNVVTASTFGDLA